MNQKRFRVRASGPIACFTRPEFKVERMSYEAMTPSAARGVLEAIFWKPQIAWRIHSIAVGKPIQWISFRRNEVTEKASLRSGPIFSDMPNVRAQRNTVALRNVDYVITASLIRTEKAGDSDPQEKYEAMFQRRLENGQSFTTPYLGCREFPADIAPAPAEWRPIDEGVSRPLGLFFFDYDYSAGAPRPMFFEARLTNGVIEVPAVEAVQNAARDLRP